MGFLNKLFGNKDEVKNGNTFSHQPEWDTYMTNVDNVIGSIMVDLGLRNFAPLKDKPYVVWVSLEMNNPREDGLSSNEESEKLYQIEDTLVDSLTPQFNCLYAGRLTSGSHRDLYFYSGANTGYDKAISDIMKAFPDYKYDFGVKEDKEWGGYLDFLYPLPVQFQGMMNRRVVENLRKNGDDHSKPRKVDHYIYFKTEQGRSGFAELAGSKGFAIENTDTKTGDNEYKYMLHLTRTDKVDINSVNEYTIDLWENAPEFDGYYDGWGCPIEK